MHITVSNAAGLRQALKSARDGDVILLEPGTYSGVKIQDVQFKDVTIQSKFADRPAKLTDLLVRDSSGLNFANLEFFVDPRKATVSFQVIESKDIHFKGLEVHGSLNGSPADDGRGLLIRRSSDVSITGSEFHQLRQGVELLDSARIAVTGNTFHDIRSDGVRGGGTSDVLVARNLFHDFHPRQGDHGDAIQFWTKNTDSPARNITITDNVIARGSGGIVQGIFLSDQVGDLPFENVTITDNLVIGAMYNGIAVIGAEGLKIDGNRVVSLPDMKSWIRVQHVENGTVRGNQALEFILTDNDRVSSSANQRIAAAQDGGSRELRDWLSQNDVGDNGGPPTPGPADPEPVRSTRQFVGGTDDRETLKADDHAGGVQIDGRAGNDVLRGNKHDDILVGSSGDDRLTGGAGSDQFRFSGHRIDGRSDRDRVEDLDFSKGDLLVFNDFAPGTFADAAGVNAIGNGAQAMISSFAGIVEAASYSSRVTAFREAPGSKNLVLRVSDQDGQVQDIVIAGGYAQYLAAGGEDGL